MISDTVYVNYMIGKLICCVEIRNTQISVLTNADFTLIISSCTCRKILYFKYIINNLKKKAKFEGAAQEVTYKEKAAIHK